MIGFASRKRETNATKIVLAVIVLVYFGLCIASFVYHGERTMLGSFEAFDNDDVKYLRSAWTLLETGRLTYNYPDRPTVFIMPGLPVVLAGFVALFGRFPIWPFRIFQMLLLGGGLIVIFFIGRKLFGSRVGLGAAALMAVCPPYIYVTHLLLTEALFCFLFLLLFLATLYALTESQAKYYVWGGVLLGLCVLFRPAIILFPIVVFVMWLIRRYRLMDMLICGSIVVAIVCAILSPWIIRNAVVFHEFIPLTKSSGNPMFQGTFIDYDQGERDTEQEYHFLKERLGDDVDRYGKDERVNDRVETELAKFHLKNDFKNRPWDYVYWYTVGKTLQNWKKPFLWHELFGVGFQQWKWLHYAFLSLGFLGVVRMIGRRKLLSMEAFPLVTILFFNISHLPFYCFPRYMFPVMFCVALYGAYFFLAPQEA